MHITDTIKKIKNKKELSGIPDFFIEELVKNHLKDKKLQIAVLDKNEEDNLIKLIRAKLRANTIGFRSKKEALYFVRQGRIHDALKMQDSTRERLPHYDLLLETIKNLHPKSILDIGCGLNPLAAASKNIEYYAFDIDKNIVDVVNCFFSVSNIDGKAFLCDLQKEMPKKETDLCLALKVFDAIEKKGHKRAEALLRGIRSRIFIVSFSTKTLSGRSMNHPHRGWIERLAARLNYKCELKTAPNEIYYIIEKFAIIDKQ